MKLERLYKAIKDEYIAEIDEDLFIHLINREIKVVKTHGNYFYFEETITRDSKEVLTMEEYIKAFEEGRPKTDILNEMIEFRHLYGKVETTHFLDIFQVYAYNPKAQPSNFYKLLDRYNNYYDSDRDSISITHKDGKDIIMRTRVVKITRISQFLAILNDKHLSFFY